ncbi:hypothetical protein D3C72_1590430 [compost metagenome]
MTPAKARSKVAAWMPLAIASRRKPSRQALKLMVGIATGAMAGAAGALAAGWLTWGWGAAAGFCAGASAQEEIRERAEAAARLRNIRPGAVASNIGKSRGCRMSKPRP